MPDGSDVDYLDGWLHRRIHRQVEEALPSLLEAEMQRRAALAARTIAEGICICSTCGSVIGHHEQLKTRVTIAEVVSIVAAEFGVTAREILSDTTQRKISLPRQVAMWLAIRALLHTTPFVGRIFQRDHSTVIHGIRAIEKRMISDADLAANCNRLRREIEAARNTLLTQAPIANAQDAER